MKLTEALLSIINTTFRFYSAALFVAFLLITYTTIQILKCARSSRMIISMMRSYCLLRDSSDRRIVSSLGIPSGLSTARATRGSTYDPPPVMSLLLFCSVEPWRICGNEPFTGAERSSPVGSNLRWKGAHGGRSFEEFGDDRCMMHDV